MVRWVKLLAILFIVVVYDARYAGLAFVVASFHARDTAVVASVAVNLVELVRSNPSAARSRQRRARRAGNRAAEGPRPQVLLGAAPGQPRGDISRAQA